MTNQEKTPSSSHCEQRRADGCGCVTSGDTKPQRRGCCCGDNCRCGDSCACNCATGCSC